MGHSYIIVGCGVFGLTTALELSTRDPACTIILLDRHEPPVLDGASVDSSRIIRADYGDAIYADLARRAQVYWRADVELRQAYRECGLLLNTADGKVEKGYLDAAIQSVKALGLPVEELEGDAVLEKITGSKIVDKNRRGLGLRGYINYASGFADARMGIEILYRRARKRSNICFKFTPVTALVFAHDNDLQSPGHDKAFNRTCPAQSPQESKKDEQKEEKKKKQVIGVQTAESIVLADTTILAMGAWQLPDLPLPTMATGQVIGYIALTDAEIAQYSTMPVHINFSTGWFCIPPYQGHLKIARHAQGYLNSEHLTCADGSTRTCSVPRTALTHAQHHDHDHKHDDENGKNSSGRAGRIPAEGERALRKGLELYLPELAEREFADSRVCWYTDTATADFIVDWHPEHTGLFIATGGSGHGYKFLPILGDLIASVLDGSMQNKELLKKWSFSQAVAAYEQGIKGDGSRGKGARLEWNEIDAYRDR